MSTSSANIAGITLLKPRLCVRSVSRTASRKAATALDHLFLSISTQPLGEEKGGDKEMDEGGNGILSRADSGDISAAGEKLPRSLRADGRSRCNDVGRYRVGCFRGFTSLRRRNQCFLCSLGVCQDFLVHESRTKPATGQGEQQMLEYLKNI